MKFTPSVLGLILGATVAFASTTGNVTPASATLEKFSNSILNNPNAVFGDSASVSKMNGTILHPRDWPGSNLGGQTGISAGIYLFPNQEASEEQCSMTDPGTPLANNSPLMDLFNTVRITAGTLQSNQHIDIGISTVDNGNGAITPCGITLATIQAPDAAQFEWCNWLGDLCPMNGALNLQTCDCLRIWTD